MTAHSVHPSIRENGLDNDCPRCIELAERPFHGLDDRNLADLIHRIVNKLDSRSVSEAIAMARVTDAMAKAQVLWNRGWRPS